MRIFVLTGAGVSAESGLGTFRDKDGLWAKYDLQEVATPEGFAADPGKVWDFYSARRLNLAAAKPNAAHLALAELQLLCAGAGGEALICTQNIDDLHEQAGATDVIHMHGELAKSRCAPCGHVFPDPHAFGPERDCPACGEVGRVRPHVVWFGEMPLEMERIYHALDQADLFVSIGTSGSVYPAAGFVAAARANGVVTVELNLEPSENAFMFEQGLYGPASEVTPHWVARLRAALQLDAGAGDGQI